MSVTLETSLGNLKFELYCEKCPKTCFNFLALSASDYYIGCLFHRNILGFLVQTGDPSGIYYFVDIFSLCAIGTGKNGKSIYEKEFEDEFHPDLKVILVVHHCSL